MQWNQRFFFALETMKVLESINQLVGVVSSTTTSRKCTESDSCLTWSLISLCSDDQGWCHSLLFIRMLEMDICPLLIRPSFLGRTYHDFQIQFESPSVNCTKNALGNPLLVQFTRILNNTLNESVYILYDRSKPTSELPHVQVFHNDHVNLCIRSAMDPRGNATSTCHEFNMITMLSSSNRTFWPLLIVFAYLSLLCIGMCLSFMHHWRSRFGQSLVQSSISRKFIPKRSIRLFLKRDSESHRLTTLNGRKEVLKAIDSIAKEFQPKSGTYIIRKGHINRAYL